MPIQMSQARTLCTKAELELLLKTTTKFIGDLSTAKLESLIRRSRTLRDKYKTLASRQRRTARGKQKSRSKNPSISNDNTVKKQEFFAQALEKFQSRLETLEERAAKTANRKKVAKASKAAKSSKATSSKKSPASKKTATSKKSSTTKKASSTKTAARSAASTTEPLRKRLTGARNILKKAGSGKSTDTQNDSQPAPFSLHVDSIGEANALDLTLQTKSEATQAMRTRSIQGRANLPKIHGHVSSRGRRNQARRDSK